jgi:integrase/recombinase XerD
MIDSMPGRIDIGEASEDILELDNEEIIELFLETLEASGASRDTIKAYRSALKDFNRFLNGKPFRNVKITDIIRWRNYHLKTGFTRPRSNSREEQRTTLHYYNMFVRRFLRWLGIRIHVPNVKKPPRKISYLSDDEIRRICAAAKNPLDKLILDLLLDTGLRSKELLNIRVKDIDFNNATIRVTRAKYGKERQVIVTPTTLLELKAWIELNSLKNDDRIIPLTYSGLYKRIKRLAGKAGINPQKVHPHLFRHTFATMALRKGMSIASLQRLMGHSDIKTTQIYTHLTIEDIRKEYFETIGASEKPLGRESTAST